jgi:peptidoglycan/LPS O-acetylase OafA/YrhL
VICGKLPSERRVNAQRKRMDMKGHVGYLDGWRGLAIILVLQSHFFPDRWVETGRLGVDVFFCLSGLLMAELLFIKCTPLGKFYQRRASRILPAFLVFVCVIYSLEHVVGKNHPWGDFLATVTFLRSYVPVTPGLWDSDLPIGHLWSLNVEEHAYLLMSVLTLPAVLLARRRAALVLMGMGLLSFAVHVIYLRWWTPVNCRLHTEVLAANILLAAGYRLVRLESVPAWLPLIAFGGAVSCYTPHAPWWAESVISPILLAIAVNHLGQIPSAVRKILEWRALQYMGAWSFSLYLWQQPYFELKKQIGVLPALALAVATGLASFYGLEQPARAWLNSRPFGVRSAAGVPTPL